MKSDRHLPVAIVGGGFSGTMIAAQLARRGVDCVLIEATKRAGLGTAFSTREPAHLLNVRAEAMSAWPDEPNHFARYYQALGGDSRGFAERRLFGEYLREILQEALASGRLGLIEERATNAAPVESGWIVELGNGASLEAAAVVLANGNQPPQPMRSDDEARPLVIDNPWGEESRRAIELVAASGDAVLILGTGLTMVDMVLSLDAAGHKGRTVALSRRGLVPRAHADFEPSPIAADAVPMGSERALWRWLRRRSAEVGWRAAVDALRPHSHAIWQSLTVDRQRRFLRHARPWWDVHRHRIAPEVAALLRRRISQGQLEIVAGRLTGIDAADGALDVHLQPRGRQTSLTERVAFAFNCTGPLGVIANTRDPLLAGLLREGRARPDQLGMGLEVDRSSRVAGASRLWALGPLTKGRYWEIVAVPDIRAQAAQVAEDVAVELGR